jgi:hypothetical protein
MPITKLQFKPGIHREGTGYSEEGSWFDCDKVRFRSQYPEKIGGWERVGSSNFKGVARAMMNWTLLDSTDCLAIGTHKKFYIEEGAEFLKPYAQNIGMISKGNHEITVLKHHETNVINRLIYRLGDHIEAGDYSGFIKFFFSIYAYFYYMEFI